MSDVDADILQAAPGREFDPLLGVAVSRFSTTLQ